MSNGDYRRKVEYVIQVSMTVWRDVDVVDEASFVDTAAARADTLARLDQYRKCSPRLTYRATVRITEDFPIFPEG